MQVPGETELFNAAVSTRDGCKRLLGERSEDAISLLAVAAFQLQAAHVGAHMAEMAGEGRHSESLRDVATDYGGVFSAALNLSVRCASTAIDLCAASLGRLAGIASNPDREMDAAEFRRAVRNRHVPALMAAATDSFLARLSSRDFADLETLRHQVTHKRYRRGVYGTTNSPPEPAPLAFPRQMDIEVGSRMVPVDKATRWCVELGEVTFRDLCGRLGEIGSA